MALTKVGMTAGTAAKGAAVAAATGAAVVTTMYVADPSLFGAEDDHATTNAVTKVQNEEEEEDQQVDEYALDKLTWDDLRMTGMDAHVPGPMFDTFDVDESGEIEGRELEVSMQRVAPLIANMMTMSSGVEQQAWSDPDTFTVHPVVESVFNGIDGNGDGNGMLHVDEYDTLWISQDEFPQMDTDQSGDLSAMEALHAATFNTEEGLRTVNPGAAPLTEEVARGYWQGMDTGIDFPSNAFQYWNHQGGDNIEAAELASRVVISWDALDGNQDGHVTPTEQVHAYRAEVEPHATAYEYWNMRNLMMGHFSISMADLQAAGEAEVPADASEAAVEEVADASEAADEIITEIEEVDTEIEAVDAEGDAEVGPEAEVPAVDAE